MKHIADQKLQQTTLCLVHIDTLSFSRQTNYFFPKNIVRLLTSYIFLVFSPGDPGKYFFYK